MSAQRITAFTLPATGGAEFSLSSVLGKPLVIFFYPKDNTPGCTIENTQFRDLYPEFEKLGCTIVGVSRDSLKSHENFKAKFSLPFELLADTQENLCQQFSVMKQKMMYGKQVRGIERSTFVIDRNGDLAREWRGLKADGHPQEVLDFVRTLV